jgi:hypothetical protein
MWRRFFLIASLSTAIAFPALAFERPFPQTAKRGTMSPANYPEILIDGQARRLSVGARIWNQQNMIQLPAYLQGSGFTVNYTVNPQGEIDRVWILTAEEANRPAPADANAR